MAVATGTLTVSCASIEEKQFLSLRMTDLIGAPTSGIADVRDGSGLDLIVDISLNLTLPGN